MKKPCPGHCLHAVEATAALWAEHLEALHYYDDVTADQQLALEMIVSHFRLAARIASTLSRAREGEAFALRCTCGHVQGVHALGSPHACAERGCACERFQASEPLVTTR